MWEFLVLLLIGGSLVLLIMQMRRSRKAQPGADAVQGTLLVTGASPRPPGATGEQLVTITGALNGPTVADHVTYRQIVRDVDDWPRIGDLIPVLYPPKNPDRWTMLLAPQQYPSGPPPIESIDPSPPPPGHVDGPPSSGGPTTKHEPPSYEPPPV